MKLYYKLHKPELGQHDIQLIERDSREPSGATAQTLTRELLVNDKVDILVGYQFSPDAIASAPVATQAKNRVLRRRGGRAGQPGRQKTPCVVTA